MTAKPSDTTKAALEKSWKETSSRLADFIERRVADPATAEDILHDVFIKFQRHFQHFEDPSKIPAWLFLVARNTVIDYYRTRKPTSELPDSLPAESCSAAQPEMEELHSLFRQIIDRLPEHYREAILLTEFENLSQTELAQHLGISVSGAKSRVQRGREHLKEILIEFCRHEFRHSVGCSPCPCGLIPPASMISSQETEPRRKSRSRR